MGSMENMWIMWFMGSMWSIGNMWIMWNMWNMWFLLFLRRYRGFWLSYGKYGKYVISTFLSRITRIFHMWIMGSQISRVMRQNKIIENSKILNRSDNKLHFYLPPFQNFLFFFWKVILIKVKEKFAGNPFRLFVFFCFSPLTFGIRSVLLILEDLKRSWHN